MNRIKLLIILAFIGLGLNAQNFTVDTKKSEIIWDAKHASGSGHVGTVDVKEGFMKLSGNKIKSAKILMNMNTLVNTDGKDGQPSERMVGHLKGENFFNVKKFPTAEFILTGSGKFKNDETKAYGRITIKGITQPINFIIKRDGSIFSTKVKIDRTLFGIKSRSGKFFPDLGDRAINDEFELDITLVLTRS